MVKIIFSQAIIIFLALIFQESLLTVLPFGLNSLNVIALLAVFGLFLWPAKRVFFTMLLLGFLLDLYSFFYFGLYTFLLLFIFAFVKIFLDKILTTRSLYSLAALVAIVVVIWQLAFWVLFSEQSWNLKFLFIILAKTLIVNLVAVLIIFYLIHYLGKHLTPVFIFQQK